MTEDATGPELGILLAMLYVAVTDGHLADDELKALEAEVHDMGLHVDVKSLILKHLQYPPTPVDLARRVPGAVDRRHALKAAVRAAFADGSEVESEHRALVALARAFEVPEAELNGLRSQAAGASVPPKPGAAYLEALREKLNGLGAED